VFGQLVVAHRRRLGLTQEELAEKAGLSVRTIIGLESGRGPTPRPASVRLLADAFGLHGEQRQAFLRVTIGPDVEPPPDPAAPSRGRPVPAQLPADVCGFTGRTAELAELDLLLGGDVSDPDRPATPVLISAVSGTAGVGKTALAVRWAHHVRHRFPDGQLYVNLRGYDPDRPVAPGDALAGFLAALGVSGPQIPVDLDERAARYRTEVAGARMLVLLDNAASAEQVRPLLPGTASCAVIVTSRDSLAGLVARDGARRLDLELLPPADAYTLLRRLVGRRVDAEPEAAATLVEQCVRLPLALRLAAELAVARPALRLAELALELADEQRRMAVLDAGGDPRAAIAAVFSWSLRQLPPDPVRLFRLLGRHPGPDADVYAAAALAGTDLPLAQQALSALERSHLVAPTGTGRYGMHDLLRAYAVSLGEDRAASERLFDYYLAAASAAMDRLHPAEKHRRPTAPAARTPLPPLDTSDAAREWLDAERPTLIAVIAHTAAYGWPAWTVRLTGILHRHFSSGQYTDSVTAYGHSRDAARLIGDRTAEAEALLSLGIIRGGLGQHQLATQDNRLALALFGEAGDVLGQARSVSGLGHLDLYRGRYLPAAEHYRAALELYRQVGDRVGEARALGNLGIVELRLARYESAEQLHARALEVFRQLGDRAGEAVALHSLGEISEHLGRYDEAADYLDRARAIYRSIGHRVGQTWVEDAFGTVQTRRGRIEQAEAHHRRALELFRELDDRDGEARALNGLGDAATAAGRPADALPHHAAALAIMAETGSVDMLDRIHLSFGDAHRALGDPAAARQHYEHALRRYVEMGSGRAAEVQVRLDALPASSDRDVDQ
jgi:tetratricopeptide (TPR) repeat protein/transcriptional regulator with XRE-family HTH domain